MIATGILLQRNVDDQIGRGLESYFLGVLVYWAFLAAKASPRSKIIAIGMACLTVSAWIVTLAISISGTAIDIPTWGSGTAARLKTSVISQNLAFYWSVFILFPLTILSLALVEANRGTLGRRIAFIGDFSYSSYLLQFPLQIVFAAVVVLLELPATVYYSPITLALFFCVLGVLSLSSHRYFEVPAQR